MVLNLTCLKSRDQALKFNKELCQNTSTQHSNTFGVSVRKMDYYDYIWGEKMRSHAILS